MNPIVRVEEVSRVYAVDGRTVPALSGVNLEVAAGSFVALKGRSGSGKTTLLNLIGGLDRPSAGRVYLEGQPLAEQDEKAMTDLRRRRLGFIFQSFALIPTYSAFENVELVLRLAGSGVSESRQRAVQCLRAVGLGNRLHSPPRRTFRRPAAARGRGARHGQSPGPDPGRRAHRRAGQRHHPPDAGFAAPPCRARRRYPARGLARSAHR
jgi:predicted ABC-type transport system involved in lysophospholipase L1 biosynthesis ATPase subunit